MAKIARIGRHRSGNRWKLQLSGYEGHYDIVDVYAEVDIPAADTITLSLAEEFLEAIAQSKGLTMKARRGNDE